MKTIKVLAIMFTIGIPAISWAWDGQTTGTIKKIDVAGGENYGFRIQVVGDPGLCGNSNTWAYLNASESNYNAYVSVLLAAKMSQQSVTIYTTKETTSGNEYCHIGYVSMNQN